MGGCFIWHTFCFTYNMKTLVIHPEDITTDFLKEIYHQRGFTVISGKQVPNSVVRREIRNHDRIIMLGHGSEDGLFGHGRFFIDSSHVQFLRDKICVGIWCNADVFFRKYKLKGIFSGMIISEQDEAYMFSVPVKPNELDVSNKIFASSVSKIINMDIGDEALALFRSYYALDIPVVEFNSANMYYAL